MKVTMYCYCIMYINCVYFIANLPTAQVCDNTAAMMAAPHKQIDKGNKGVLAY